MTTSHQGAPNGAPEPNNGHVYNIALIAAVLSLNPQSEDPIGEAMGLTGDVRIRLREALAGKQAARQAPGGKAAEPSTPAPQQSKPQQPQGEERDCPKCGGRMWDNRASKRNPRAPDFKCRDRSCDGVIWPPRDGEEQRGASDGKRNPPARRHEYDDEPDFSDLDEAIGR